MILSCSRLLRSLLSLLFGRQLSLWLLRKKHTLKADQNKECSFFHGPMLTGRRGFVEPANCLSQTLNEIFDLLVSEEVEELGLMMMERKSVMRWSVRRRRRDWSNSVIGIGAVGATVNSRGRSPRYSSPTTSALKGPRIPLPEPPSGSKPGG